jgi:N12 class adenine-specific DNA methylase
MADPPRRRMTDHDRRRWPDERLDEQHDLVDELRRDLQAALRAVSRLEGLRDVAEAQRDLIETQAARISDLRGDMRVNQRAIKELENTVRQRFDVVDVAHDRTEKRATGVDPDTGEPLPPPFKPDVRFWLKLAAFCTASVGVPIALALITGGGS